MIAWPPRWPLHTLGVLLLAVVACSGDGASGPSVVTEITLDTEAVVLDATGQARQLTATALGENGDPVSNPPIEWSSSDAAIVTVSESGLLVAQAPGAAEVTAAVGEVSATATVAVNSIATMAVFEGNGQTAVAGQPVPTAPAVRVTDGDDDPVAGVRVRFQANTASGSVTGESQLTGVDGVARAGSWRLGASGVNTLSVSVEGAEVLNEPVQFLATTADVGGYNITVHYLGEYTSEQLRAFAEAEIRWESIVTGDLIDVNGDLPADQCGEHPGLEGPFDDLTIFVRVEEIDGPGNILGQAGPGCIRVPGVLTVIGLMFFDVDDIDELEAEGSLQAVILHEMGHVIGFGTLWNNFALVQDSSQADPEPPLADTHFTGEEAIAAFNAAGGTSYSGAKVPVMNLGGAGTVNSHWRDDVFDPEVMTGFLNAGGVNPVSAVTIASLADLGYVVNVAEADPFTLAPAFRIAGPRQGRRLVDDILRQPIRRIDTNGRVVGVLQR